MASFKVLSIKEINIMDTRLVVSATLEKEADDGITYTYELNEGIVYFQNGYPKELEIIRLNQNNSKSTKSLLSTNVEMIEDVILDKLKESVVPEARRVLGNSLLKIQEFAELVPSNTVDDVVKSFRMKPKSKVNDLIKLYRIYASLIDRHFLKESCDSIYPKAMDLAIVTNPTYLFLSEIRTIVSKMYGVVDSKLSLMVLDELNSSSLSRIYEMDLRRFLTDDTDSVKVDSILAFASKKFMKNSLVPYTLLLKKEPKLFVKIIEKNTLKLQDKLSGELHSKIEYDKDIHGLIYLINEVDRKKITLKDRSYSHEIVGINFKIGKGTFNIHSLTPSKYSQSMELSSPLTLGILEEGITSEKATLENCFILFDMDITYHAVVDNKLTKQMKIMSVK